MAPDRSRRPGARGRPDAASAPRRAVALALVAGLIALAGCGGGGSSHADRAQYIAKADAICQAAKKQTGPLIQQLSAEAAGLTSGSAASASKAAGIVEQLHTIAAADLAQLRALKQPSGDHAAIAKFLDPLGSLLNSLNQAASVLRSGQVPQALALLQQAQPTAQQVTTAAQQYGLKQCGTVLSLLS